MSKSLLKIHILSHSNLRYDGYFCGVNTNDISIILSHVRLYGKQERAVPLQLAPPSNMYEYMIFKGADIKEIIIEWENLPQLPSPKNLNQQNSVAVVTPSPVEKSNNAHPSTGISKRRSKVVPVMKAISLLNSSSAEKPDKKKCSNIKASGFITNSTHVSLNNSGKMPPGMVVIPQTSDISNPLGSDIKQVTKKLIPSCVEHSTPLLHQENRGSPKCNSKKSFFDTLSCEYSISRTEKENWFSMQQKLNSETFGECD